MLMYLNTWLLVGSTVLRDSEILKSWNLGGKGEI